MFKLILISTLLVAAYCMPAEKSETSWNAAGWNNPANPNAAWGGNSWNRWNNPNAPNADPRWNRWGADPWSRQWGGANPGWNQWNRAGAWPGAGAGAAARGWNPW
ncbi:bifunctional endo-1,4-beta-xylanase XylA-like isoform X2 [Armigeres subalbatus]|uniref:bifunctional endo-1,4-beta-xylanase XylA-like isoform X2 n=1 Tax=Armigeres subalbatus TaxID=124917 RepID=UPI002ED63008